MRSARIDLAVMPGKNESNGFTLVELIVVMALISLMFFMILPRVNNDIFIDQTKKTSRWLLTSVRYLKEASTRDQTSYALHVDIDNGRLWTSHVSASEEMLEKYKDLSLILGEGSRILDVELAGERKITSGTVLIQFHAKGYSDHAMIHMTDGDDNELSYKIPPFLPRLKIYEGYVDLEG